MTEPASWHIVNQVKELGLQQATKTFERNATLVTFIDELLEAGIEPKAGASSSHQVIGFLNNWVFQRESGYWEGFGADYGWGFSRTFSKKEDLKSFAEVLKGYNFRTQVHSSFIRRNDSSFF